MPQTLLLADDSLTIQRVIELTFAGENITVVAVSDGDQAIARLDTEPPDIVLADVGMPGRNGYDVAQHVKQTPTLSHIPVVLLTGAFEPVDQAKATAVGCDAVLAKPFEPQLVIGRVRELLGRQAPAAVGVAPAVEPAAAPAVDAAIPTPAVDATPTPSVDATTPTPAADASPVDDYFDRLDAAFASLSPSPALAAVSAETPNDALPEPPNELDWLRLYATDEPAAAADVPDLPVEPQSFVVADELAAEPPAFVEPRESFEPRETVEPRDRVEPAHPVEPQRPVEPQHTVEPRRSLPSVADAFAAILAAEQNALGVRPEWPEPPPSAAPAPAVVPAGPIVASDVTDEVIDRIARRVIEQLSDRVVRETVAQIASEAAERLVREEIEAIKSAIE